MIKSPSELNERNYRRIATLNWLLALPLLILFSWPYLLICEFLRIQSFYSVGGSLVFALPFMITILHGHVTMALGSLHRHHFYRWLRQNSFSYGFLFHELFVSTRFRLSVLALSLLLLAFGWFVSG